MKKRKCITKHCRNAAAKHRTVCHKCAREKWKKDNPEKFAYENLKTNAKRRGKVFTLTFEQFKQFAYKTNYITGKGKTKTSITIDCKEPEKGYTADNIQPLQLCDNAAKGKKQLIYDWETKTAFVYKINGEKRNIDLINDLPF